MVCTDVLNHINLYAGCCQRFLGSSWIREKKKNSLNCWGEGKKQEDKKIQAAQCELRVKAERHVSSCKQRWWFDSTHVLYCAQWIYKVACVQNWWMNSSFKKKKQKKETDLWLIGCSSAVVLSRRMTHILRPLESLLWLFLCLWVTTQH